MTNVNGYVSLREILSRVTRHPMLQDVDLEAAIQYTLEFFAIVGVPDILVDRQDVVCIKNFKGELPCDAASIIQVRDEKSKAAMREMTDSFNGNSRFLPSERTFKLQNRIIVTSFREGNVLISYKAIKTDSDGIPMLPDDQLFLRALESYIKYTRFTVLFDTGKIKDNVLNKAEQDYSWNVGKCINHYKMPSYSEMQSITGMMHRLIPSQREFYAGFKGAGDSEYYRRHQG